jgi:hypothetical protein
MQKPSSAMMKLALMRTATGKENPELPLLQRTSSLEFITDTSQHQLFRGDCVNQAFIITTQDMTQTQTQEVDGSVLRSFIITQGAGKGQVEDRQRFVSRSESDRCRTAGRLKTGWKQETGL